LATETARRPSDGDALFHVAPIIAIWAASVFQRHRLALGFDVDGGHPSGRRWTPLAIHRTFLARDGGGKAPVDPQKMMLGPCREGTVRLADPGEVLMVGEGIETLNA
jgi:hypothetical protein